MQPSSIIAKLKRHQEVFRHLLQSATPEQYTFKPDPKSWCLLEVICHLLDEEIEDFKARIAHILTHSDKPLIPISPETWPTERNYLGQDFESVLQQFLDERKQSVDWLQSLQHPNWEQTVDHPDVGPRSAKKFLINWLAHDYHHIRQINKIQHAYLMHASGDDLTYAGKW